jgi:hypothetical protein
VPTIQIASNKANFLIFVIVDYLFPILICGNTAIFVLASMIANLMQHFNSLAQTSIFWQKTYDNRI